MVQDPYSLRCAAQVHGASRDTLNHAKRVVEIELNAATDNPLVFIEEGKNSWKKNINFDIINPLIDDLENLPGLIQSVLDHGNDIIPIAQHFIEATNFLYLGRGYQFPVALEGALKLKEISYIHAEGYPAAEMKHGPIALIDDNMPVVFIVTQRGYAKVVSNIQEVCARGGKIIIITSEMNDELQEYSEHIIQVPKVHHCLQAVLTTIPLQLLAYHIAVLKDCDVDMPRNLAKSVTVE